MTKLRQANYGGSHDSDPDPNKAYTNHRQNLALEGGRRNSWIVRCSSQEKVIHLSRGCKQGCSVNVRVLRNVVCSNAPSFKLGALYAKLPTPGLLLHLGRSATRDLLPRVSGVHFGALLCHFRADPAQDWHVAFSSPYNRDFMNDAPDPIEFNRMKKH